MLLQLAKARENNAAIQDLNGCYSYKDLIEKIHLFQTYLKTYSDQDICGLETDPSFEFICLFFTLLTLGKKVCLFTGKHQKDKLKHFGITTIFSIKDIKSDKENCPSFPLKDNSKNSHVLVFSSGTTSSPKLISSSFTAHLKSATNAKTALSLDETSKYLLSLPLNHISGIAPIFRCLLSSSCLVIDYSFNQDPATCLSKHLITHLSCVSTQLKRLLNSTKQSILSLKSILVGGSHIDQKLIQSAFEKKLPIFLSYGMTETNSMVCINNVLKTKNFLSCGKPFENVQIRLSSTSEIQINSPVLFDIYHLDKQKTYKRSNWYQTSDIGKFDKDGFLYISHRADEIFISGGYNINPKDIEHALENILGIEKAKVIPVKHKDFGFSAAAFYYSKTELPPQDIYQQLKISLNFYQIPKQLIFWDFENYTTKKVTHEEKQKMLNHLQNLNEST